MKIKDKKLLNDSIENMNKNYLIGIFAIVMTISVGFATKFANTSIDYLLTILIGLFVFLIVITMLIRIEYKKKLREKRKRENNNKHNFELAMRANDYK